MKKNVKKIIFILIVLILLFSVNTKVFAWDGVIKDGQGFIQAGEKSGQAGIDKEALKNLSGYLYNILLTAGVIIAVIVATVLGVQFMIGGAEGQAKVKEMLIPFVIGCIVVFGGFGLWKIAVTIGNQLEKTSVLDSKTEQTYIIAIK